MARAAGLHMPSLPGVQVVPDESVASHRASVQASFADEPHDSTQALEPVQPAPENAATALNASLISGEDHRVIPLGRDVVNVGRSRENHIILDDPRVSRQHAQLRLRFGRYVLYDLDSQGGTIVNGQPVQECILQHGDVISLGGVKLIYTEDGEDSSGDAPATDLHNLDDTDAHPPVGASS
jgi:pSer/pThr/pTyr-binding forkhead associated (FHA) protein